MISNLWIGLMKISVGSIVLIGDKNLGPIQWKLGCVVEVTTSPDGVIRTVCVKNGQSRSAET